MNGWMASAVAGCAVAGVLMGAPQAQADESAYLTSIGGDWVSRIFGPEVMVSEGHKVCSVLAGGPPSAQAIDMVQTDMSVPRFTALNIVNAAMDNLC